MSVLAGLFSRSGEDVTSRLAEMLGAASRAHSDAYGFASPDAVEHRVGGIEPPGFASRAALGFRHLRTRSLDTPQPLNQGKQSLIFSGDLWDTQELGCLVVSDLVRGGAEWGLKHLLCDRSGSWAATTVEDEKLLCCRDPIGVIPLYCGVGDDLLGVSSNAKTLESVGLAPRRVEPGHLLTLGPKGCSDEGIIALEKPTQAVLSMEDAIGRLDTLLTTAVTRSCRGIDSPTLAFSGGIDSVILAHYLGKAGARPRLACVGSEGSPDLEAAEKAAKALNMPVIVSTYDETDVEENLDAVLLSVEEADPMKVGVAFPLYLVALGASGRRSKIIVSGGGSDELFGGYSRYIEEYQTNGTSVTETMFRDVCMSYAVNYERDWKICSDVGFELRLPYTDPDLTAFALSLPLEYKMPKKGSEPRKAILRRLASTMGLPEEVVNRPKKAAQYSSGAARMLERLAKREGKTISGFLAKRIKEISK